MNHVAAEPRGHSTERAGTCPHVNRNDPRCATRFSLGRIEQAFSVCFGAYHGCPMYHRINGEDRATVRATPPIVVTISARSPRHDVPVPLRATGT